MLNQQLPLLIAIVLFFQNASLNGDNPVLRLTRAGGTVTGSLPGTDWTVFTSDSNSYLPLEWAYPSVTHYAQEKLCTVILVSSELLCFAFYSSVVFLCH